MIALVNYARNQPTAKPHRKLQGEYVAVRQGMEWAIYSILDMRTPLHSCRSLMAAELWSSEMTLGG